MFPEDKAYTLNEKRKTLFSCLHKYMFTSKVNVEIAEIRVLPNSMDHF